MEHNVLLIMVVCITAALMLGAVDGYEPKYKECSMTPDNFKDKFVVSCTANVGISKCKSLWEAFSGAFAFKDQTNSAVPPE